MRRNKDMILHEYEAYFSDSTLHDNKIRVVDIQLNPLE